MNARLVQRMKIHQCNSHRREKKLEDDHLCRYRKSTGPNPTSIHDQDDDDEEENDDGTLSTLKLSVQFDCWTIFFCLIPLLSTGRGTKKSSINIGK